jgi:hypothetical protein
MAMAAPAPSSSWRLRASLVVRGVHLGVVAFFLVGWTLPWRGALWAVVVGALVTQVGWWFARNRCVLTLLEEWLRHGSQWASSGRDANFVARLLTSVTGRDCPGWLATAFSYAVLWMAIAASVVRLRR